MNRNRDEFQEKRLVEAGFLNNVRTSRRCPMVTKSQWLAWLCVALLFTILAGCATAPPKELIERNDHSALANWYEKEAASLRQRADQMNAMALDYQKRMTKPGQQSDLVRHCEKLGERYRNAAQEADALAQLHRDQIGKP